VAAPLIEGVLMTAPDAVVVTKRLVCETAGSATTVAFRETLVVAAVTRRSDKAREGLASFAERRKLVFGRMTLRRYPLP